MAGGEGVELGYRNFCAVAMCERSSYVPLGFDSDFIQACVCVIVILLFFFVCDLLKLCSGPITGLYRPVSVVQRQRETVASVAPASPRTVYFLFCFHSAKIVFWTCYYSQNLFLLSREEQLRP